MRNNLYTKMEVCDWLHISLSTLDRWRAKGLPCIKFDRAVRFEKYEVLKFLEKRDEDK